MLDQALAHLNQLIQLGAEFPDAVYSTSIAFECSHEELTALYDNQFN